MAGWLRSRLTCQDGHVAKGTSERRMSHGTMSCMAVTYAPPPYLRAGGGSGQDICAQTRMPSTWRRSRGSRPST